MSKASPGGSQEGPESPGHPRPQNGGDSPDEVPVADAELEARLAATDKELAETRDQLLRNIADQDNARKLALRERDEAVRYAASQLAKDMLDSLDDLRRAIVTTRRGDAVDGLLAGVSATERNLLSALGRHGIRRVEPMGEPFDPRLHEAVFQREDTTADDGSVIEVVQPGYVMHDRLLRPARVGVAKNDGGQPSGE